MSRHGTDDHPHTEVGHILDWSERQPTLTTLTTLTKGTIFIISAVGVVPLSLRVHSLAAG